MTEATEGTFHFYVRFRRIYFFVFPIYQDSDTLAFLARALTIMGLARRQQHGLRRQELYVQKKTSITRACLFLDVYNLCGSVSNLGTVNETRVRTRQNKSGLRRRGHLLKALGCLSNDPNATPKQRLEACKMLFELETAPDSNNEQSNQTAKYSNDLRSLAARFEQSDTV